VRRHCPNDPVSGAAIRSEFARSCTSRISLGLLYSAFTYYIGFKVNSGEYKVMGLAPYGEPRYATLIFDNLIDLKGDGTFRGSVLFRLLHRPAHDQREVRCTVRRAAAQVGSTGSTSTIWILPPRFRR
jgi:predicted NodU family carbamoyl transferase